MARFQTASAAAAEQVVTGFAGLTSFFAVPLRAKVSHQVHEATSMYPRNSTLLLIDVQQGFLDPAWGPRNNPEAEDNIGRLLALWRDRAMPVRHVHHASRSSTGSFRAGTPGYQPKPQAMPQTGEPIHVKEINSGFIGTTLERDLRADGVSTLVIVGLTTNHCVSTTARMAGNLGFETYVVEDATATFDRAGLDGRMRPAAEVHASALSDLADEFATITSTDHLLRALGYGPEAIDAPAALLAASGA